MSSEHAAHPYYKVFVWLTVLTIAEIAWALVLEQQRFLLVSGLGLMAAIKAALVGMYYMHLKYEGRIIWFVIAFPIVLVCVMIAGLLPDSFRYW